MIQIQHYPLDPLLNEQEIHLKGLMGVIAITMINKKTPAAVVVVNTSEHINRVALVYLLKENQNAICLLKGPRYVGDVKGYYLFLKEIRPKPRQGV